jgi:phenylalanyl-tRNA synthetase beta chain
MMAPNPTHVPRIKHMDTNTGVFMTLATRRALCSRAETFDMLRRDPSPAVEIGNPATAEFEVARTCLLPAALKTLGANKDAPLPVKLFEVRKIGLGTLCSGQSCAF